MKFSELIETQDLDTITYFDFLRCDEWIERRTKIIERDNFCCTECGNKKTYLRRVENGQTIYSYINGEGQTVDSRVNIYLQVHHTKYIYNTLPWQYNGIYLLTLCNLCHSNLHNNESIKVYSSNELNKLEFGHCDRCRGKGYIPEYRKIQGGVCFKCKGFGYSRPLFNIREMI